MLRKFWQPAPPRRILSPSAILPAKEDVMKAKFKMLAAMLACLALAGCASRDSLVMSPYAASFGGNATFQNESVTDNSGWKPGGRRQN